MEASYKKFSEYFPKYPSADPLYERVAGALVKSTLVNKPKRRVRAVLFATPYINAADCAAVAERLRAAYSLAEVEIRCATDEPTDAALADYLKEAAADYPILKGYLAGEALAEEGGLILPVNEGAGAVLERLGLSVKLAEYYRFKFSRGIRIEFREEKNGGESAADFIARKEESIDRTAPVSRTDLVRAGEEERDAEVAGDVIYGKPITEEPVKISSLTDGMNHAVICGYADAPRFRAYTSKKEPKEGEEAAEKTMITFSVEDESGVLPIKIFGSAKAAELLRQLHVGERVILRGAVGNDEFAGGLAMRCYAVCRAKKAGEGKTGEGRVELHTHTLSSPLDATVSARELVKRAAEWGYPALAVTDHGSLRSLPEAVRAGREFGVKIIAGMEAYMADDLQTVVWNEADSPVEGTYTVFDIETTGLSQSTDRITEIGAVRVEKGEITEVFSTLVNPEMPISARITDLTGITNEMVRTAPKITEALPAFLDFAGDSVLVAHNANFDCGFIRAACRRQNLEFKNCYIDTVPLCSSVFPELKNVKLDTVAAHMGLGDFNHHRASDDAEMLARIFLPLLKDLQKKQNIHLVSQINGKIEPNRSRLRLYHVVLLAKDAEGQRVLGRLCGDSYLEHYSRKPMLPKSVLLKNREHLLIGSACMESDLFEMITQYRSEADILRAASFYDYFELQPPEVNMHLVDSGRLRDSAFLTRFYTEIMRLAEQLGKPVAATGDVHFLDADGMQLRNILSGTKIMRDEGNRGALYFRTTEQMLSDFSFLGEETAHRIVVDAPLAIAASCAAAVPVPLPAFPGGEAEERKLVAAAEKVPQEKEAVLTEPLKTLLTAALCLKDALPGICFGGSLCGLKTANILGLTDEYRPGQGECRPGELTALVSDRLRPLLQERLDAVFGERHAPFAGTALIHTPETAKVAVVRYEEDSKTVLREIVENRAAAAMSGSVRQLRAEQDSLILLPADLPAGTVPVSGTKDCYFTHFDASEYDGVFLRLRISNDKGGRMLRLCEELSGIPAREVQADEGCEALLRDAEELGIFREHKLKNGLAGCEEFSPAVRDKLLWYKLNYPQEFYCAYFTVCEDEDLGGRGKAEEIETVERRAVSGQDVSALVEYEMLLREIAFSPVNLLVSDYYCFMPDEQGDIALPLRVVEGFTERDARLLAAQREKEEYISSAELLEMSAVSRQGKALLRQAGLATDDDAQIRLF